MINFKKVIRKLHLWLGLLSGLVVFIVAITGCCWVFKEEIETLTEENFLIINPNEIQLTPTKVQEISEDYYPGKELHGVLYEGKNRPIEVVFYQASPLFYRSIFIHPASGEVLKTKNHLTGFFAFVLAGHMFLWLPPAFGSWLVKWATVTFGLLLISGIILWWPKNKKSQKQRLSFQWKSSTKWKRKNFDLHAIIGFYSSFLAIIFILTGLIMAFPSVKDAVYFGMGGDKEASFLVPTGSTLSNTTGEKPIDNLLEKLYRDYPEALDFEIHYPKSDSSAIYVEASNAEGMFYNSDFIYYDQNSLTEISPATYYGKYAEATLADKILRMNYDLHIGAILGLAGKILAFLVSLFIASLPVTGILLYYGRNFKKNKKVLQNNLK